MKQNKEFFATKQEYIDFLANKSNEINMANKNSKTGAACLNLAFPVCTCRMMHLVSQLAMHVRDFSKWRMYRQHITETLDCTMTILTISLNRFITR